MKYIIWAGIVAIVIQVCGCATKQINSKDGASYTVTWSSNMVKTIEYRSEKLPCKLLTVNISRSSQCDTVSINNCKQKIWATSVFKPTRIIFSSSGVMYFEGSKLVGSERFYLKEWKFDKSNILIYREITVNDEETDQFKRYEFYGPFELKLVPPSEGGAKRSP